MSKKQNDSVFDPHDIELTKRAGIEAGSHYLQEGNMNRALGLSKVKFTRAQCYSMISLIWRDFDIAIDQKNIPVDLSELTFEEGPIGIACVGKEDKGIHAGKYVIGLSGFNKDKVVAYALMHELTHCIRILNHDDETHGAAFSKQYVELICKYLLKVDAQTTFVYAEIFARGKKECGEYLIEKMTKAGEIVNPIGAATAY